MSPRDPANLAARNLLAERVADRHGIDPLDAHTAVTRLHLGLPSEHEHLVRQELATVIAELRAHLAEILAPITAAMQAFGEAITRAMAQLPPPPSGRGARSRPAWQSPYGPPRKGHRR
jgi:hypothetical protein